MSDTNIKPPGAPVPVVPVTRAQQWRRFSSFLAMLAGAVLQTVVENAPQISAHYPGVKWVGSALFLAGLTWSTWQRFVDTGNIEHVNLTPPADGGTP